MEKGITAVWKGWNGESREYLTLGERGGNVYAESLIISDGGGRPFAARYAIECDPGWRVRSVGAHLIGEPRETRLLSDGEGGWTDGSVELPDLKGAIDVDIFPTPFTNTLPIRRLGLGAGQSADIVVAYITLPEMSVTSAPQRYTCIEPLKAYRFESLDSDFKCDIEIDEDGLVVSYPGLFRRMR
ncbi:MAG: putative glycolipid-binding domain-containing protein [Candidatus Dadabacteria bacterium]